MWKFTTVTLISILCCIVPSTAQKLYMPRNIKMAYAKGSRSMNGNPGKNYWQNSGQYDIKVSVAPKTGIVSGSEQILYTNNSPDTLHYIAIRFVNNVHKPGAPRSHFAPAAFLNIGLDIAYFSIGDKVFNPDSLDAKDWGTMRSIPLQQAILPHASVNLHIKWSYPLSKAAGREGQIDSGTFYVAYCYPRISVYDDYNGWDMLPHKGRQEFYNDFNDYRLSVSAPENFVVWATGDLLNPDEVLQPEIAARLKRSYTSDAVLHIATAGEMQRHEVTRQQDWNTWKFVARDISDVCFGLSNHYAWDAASVITDAATGRRTSVQAAYNDTARDYHHFTEWSQYSLKYYSTEWPGVPFPFSKMTSFQGYADMEYPMMINDATEQDLPLSRMIQDHEIAHTYFPFYMGINETRYAYMDEGWATTFEYLIAQEEHGKVYADSAYKAFRVKDWISNPSTEEDQPLVTMSTQVSGDGYSYNSYVKASLSYLALKDLLGDSLFKKALHHYMDTWHGKHPIPWDYFNAMKAGSGVKLNWFFQNWFFTNDYIDLKVEKVAVQKGAYVIMIKNVGGFAIPFDVILIYENGDTETLHQSPVFWRDGKREQSLRITATKKLMSVRLDGGIFMDYTPKDNILVIKTGQ